MLAVVVFLIYIAHCSADPVLWGSRIVGTPEGPSPPMYFRHNGRASIYVWLKDKVFRAVNINNGQCYVDSEVWGGPCQMDERSANITLSDVSKQKALLVESKSSLVSTTYFVPNCTFQKPQKDEVDLKTLFPLSRFLRGQSHVELKFAARVASNESRVFFLTNGMITCTWQGSTLQGPSPPPCRNLTRDTQSDLSLFVVNITRDSNEESSTFEWATGKGGVVITVDWMQGGE
ncbi:diagnostic antigen gp50 [Echinococcus multilocularis]|uniref:Diagnostic antigen gp50 n=1 Tax=Echinococcus multilocularis TaxID=6211 RepID=A0A068Y6D3_ECHMU|nr:diagnostic antigen gp50 [Echinococcus multilocularis]